MQFMILNLRNHTVITSAGQVFHDIVIPPDWFGRIAVGDKKIEP